MSFISLSVEAIERLQKLQIDDYGGSHGLRSRDLLESAVARPENLEYYSPESTIPELAATLAWGLIKNHAFIDGNKRIGFAALTTLLGVNGFALTCTDDEATEAVLKAAAGDFSEDEWFAWVNANTAPIST